MAPKAQGWIVPTDGTRDLFVQQRNILGDDVRTLPVDAKVTYESRTNDIGCRGDQRIAEQVVPVTTSGGLMGPPLVALKGISFRNAV